MTNKINKVAWVTGASSGIGEAICYELSNKGYDLILTSRNIEKLKKVAKKLKTNSFIAKADVSNSLEVKTASETFLKKFDKIDLCILNAGIYESVDAKKINSKIFLDHIMINYMGVVNCLENIIPDMIKKKSGKILIISSAAGIRGLPKAAAYGPSKSAINNLAQSIRFDLEPKGIIIKVINLWFVLTKISPIDEHQLPGVISPEIAAQKIIKNIDSKKFEIVIPNFFMQRLLILSKFIPEEWAFKIIKRFTGY